VATAGWKIDDIAALKSSGSFLARAPFPMEAHHLRISLADWAAELAHAFPASEGELGR
jgi:hypothetical protein